MEDPKKREPTAMQKLIDAPKGQLDYAPGEAFMLHVFWETPSADAAHILLSALQRCGTATRRDTPCVPTYFFRVAHNDDDLCSPPPLTIGDHPQLRAALAKMQRGVPPPAVRADLARRGLDPALLEQDPSSELPEALRARPVYVELTEIYLDERAFNLHAGSTDYLQAYGAVMQPGLQNGTAVTLRLGTPTSKLVDTILEPMLHERVKPLAEGCPLWHSPPVTAVGDAIFLSLDVPMEASGEEEGAAAAVAASLPASFRMFCTTCLSFTHPLRQRVARLLCVLPSLLPEASDVLGPLASLKPVRGEAHLTSGGEAAAESVRAALQEAGLGHVITVNASEAVGHVLHERAADLHHSLPQGVATA